MIIGSSIIRVKLGLQMNAANHFEEQRRFKIFSQLSCLVGHPVVSNNLFNEK